jgi:hypothetical protein
MEVPLIAARAHGVVWYRRDAYAEVLRAMRDADVLPRRYDAWLKRAKQAEEQLGRRGIRSERVYLDPGEFARWCRAQGHDLDADGRLAYVNAVLADRYRDQG